MSDDAPSEDPAPPDADEGPRRSAERPRTAVGLLRTHPGAPTTTWTPPGADETPVVPREVGDLEQRGAARRRDGLRRVQGIPSLQALGWILFILGGLIYLHAVWATANAALTGTAAAEQVVAIGGAEFLQGSVGIGIMVVGLLTALVFTFVPLRLEPPIVPGTLEYEVAATNLVRMRERRRIVMGVGIVVFVVGLALAAYPLKESILQGTLYTLSVGGNGYRIHYWGYLLAAIGIALAVPLAITQGAIDRAAAVAEGALPEGRVRRVADRDETAERPRWSSPAPTALGATTAPEHSGPPLETQKTATEEAEERALADDEADDPDEDDGLLRPPRNTP